MPARIVEYLPIVIVFIQESLRNLCQYCFAGLLACTVEIVSLPAVGLAVSPRTAEEGRERTF